MFAQAWGGDFPPAGAAGGAHPHPPHTLGGDVAFTDYAPHVFRALRQAFHVDSERYLASLGGSQAFLEFASNSRSGSFFFYSHDGEFMVKSMSRAEFAVLQDMLPRYAAHMLENAGRTYLTRFLGMHSIQLSGGELLHFVVMQSVFFGAPALDEKFDLKGSTVARTTTCMGDRTKCVFKDVDFINSGARIRLGAAAKVRFLAAVSDDVEMLRREGIMDYSLLLGIHVVPPGGPATAAHSGITSSDGRLVYYMGIIDVLQRYNVKKKGETFLKTVVKREEASQLSSAPPNFYAARFTSFIASKTD